MDAHERMVKLRALTGAKASAVLLTKPENMRYYSGYTGEGWLLVLPREAVILTDFRYVEQAQAQAPGCTVRMVARGTKMTEALMQCLHGIDRLAAEDDHLTRRAWMALEERLQGVTLTGADNLPEKVRAVKTDAEIALMAQAEAIADQAFAHILGFIQPGITELDVAWELERVMRLLGSEGPAFDTIVASGPNGSLPHAIPGKRTLQTGDMITMDFGAKVGGMCSDFTRTVALGTPCDELRKVYGIVLEAQLRALDAVKPGVTGRDVDAIARAHIENAGYGERFGHGLGHGVGLMVHEAPSLHTQANEALVPGNAVTVEPGIYLPGIGGVRIEDLVAVTEDGHRNLTSSAKELVIL